MSSLDNIRKLDNIREEINTAGIKYGGYTKRKSSTRKSRGGSKINYRGSSKAGQPSNFADGAPWAPVWNFKKNGGAKKITKKGTKKSTKGKKSSKKGSKKTKRGGSNQFLTFSPNSSPQGTTDAVDIQMASTASPNTSEEQFGGLRANKNSKRSAKKPVRKNRAKKLERNVEYIGESTFRFPETLLTNTGKLTRNIVNNTGRLSLNTAKNAIRVPRNIGNNIRRNVQNGGLMQKGPMTTPDRLNYYPGSMPSGPTDAVPLQMAASSRKLMKPYVQAMNANPSGMASNAAPFGNVAAEEQSGGKKKSAGKKVIKKKSSGKKVIKKKSSGKKVIKKKSSGKKVIKKKSSGKKVVKKKSSGKKVVKKKSSGKKVVKKKSSGKGSKKVLSKKKASLKSSTHRGGSDWKGTVYSRGPVNAPNNGWYNGKKLFSQFTKTGQYIPNSDLPWAAAPGVTPGKGTIPKATPPYGYNYYSYGGKKNKKMQNKKGGNQGFEYTKMFNSPLSPCYKPQDKPEIFKAGWHA